MAGESPEYDRLLEQATAELEAKTEGHRLWGLGTEDDWNLEQDEGVLVLTRADGLEARAAAQIVGTFDSKAGTWMWAWANGSICPALAEHARRLQEYGKKHGVERLTSGSWPAQVSDCWAMTALAVKLGGAECAYRGPLGDTGTFVFMTFAEVALRKACD
jgi:hypothetical protein